VSDLLERIEANLRHRCLCPRRARLLVGVSGGLDSVVLLHVLHRLAPRHEWTLMVAHFNHRLRGQASDEDAAWVGRLAGRLGHEFVTDAADVRAAAAASGSSIEMAARRLRHEFLARTARQRRIRRIALAHHADDQVELFFLRVLRGAGGLGLSGMKWVSPSPADPSRQLIRPLLDVAREELQAYAAEHRLTFREDASNSDLRFGRNWLRHELLPQIRRRVQPALRAVTLRLVEVLGAESDYLEARAQDWLGGGERSPFERLHPAIQRRILHARLRRAGVEPTFDLIERLRLEPGVPVGVAAGRQMIHDGDGNLCVARPAAVGFRAEARALELRGRSGEADFAEATITWSVMPLRTGGWPQRRSRPNLEWFDADKVGPVVTLRHWRPGDRFQPIGLARPVKLQDFFTNQKVPRDTRRRLIIAATQAGEIFWVEGLRIGEKFKLDKRTRRGLKWEWRREANGTVAVSEPP
jgi:tRNA(Ile)-lysidine synthase